MKSLPAYTNVTPQMDDDQLVPEDLVGRLCTTTEGAVMDLVERFTLAERANLAMYCYRKAHLHGIGLAIAATCDQATLETTWGTALGRVLYLQSREHVADRPAPVAPRSKITLARSVGGVVAARDWSAEAAAAADDEDEADGDEAESNDTGYVVDLT